VIAGIDFSTKAIDIVLVDEDQPDRCLNWLHIDLTGALKGEPAGDAWERTRRVWSAMPRGGFWDEAVAIGIEEPRGHHGVEPLFRIQGAITACIPRTVLLQPWNPASWRRLNGLAGNATKLVVRNFVIQQGVWLPNWSQDACDAYCIARATALAVEVGT